MFKYTDIVTKGCKGWINLFFDDYCICLIDNITLADMIKKHIDVRNKMLDDLCELTYNYATGKTDGKPIVEYVKKQLDKI